MVTHGYLCLVYKYGIPQMVKLDRITAIKLAETAPQTQSHLGFRVFLYIRCDFYLFQIRTKSTNPISQMGKLTLT